MLLNSFNYCIHLNSCRWQIKLIIRTIIFLFYVNISVSSFYLSLFYLHYYVVSEFRYYLFLVHYTELSTTYNIYLNLCHHIILFDILFYVNNVNSKSWCSVIKVVLFFTWKSSQWTVINNNSITPVMHCTSEWK